MTGPTGADQQLPGTLDDWAQIERDQAELYADRARRQREREIGPELAEQVDHEDPPPKPGR